MNINSTQRSNLSKLNKFNIADTPKESGDEGSQLPQDTFVESDKRSFGTTLGMVAAAAGGAVAGYQLSGGNIWGGVWGTLGGFGVAERISNKNPDAGKAILTAVGGTAAIGVGAHMGGAWGAFFGACAAESLAEMTTR